MKASEFLPKSDVRQLIKVARNQVKKIDHPHARYNQLGRISCIVCGLQIKSEVAWAAHILSKTHKQNELREHTLPLKRSTETSSPGANKISKAENSVVLASNSKTDNSVATKRLTTNCKLGEKNPAEKSRESESDSKLPEGFFDDKYQDAKVRHVPYRDKLTEEIDLFQKELVALEKESEVISERESEAMVTRRELDEIDEQLEKWKKIEGLQVEKESIEAKLKSNSKQDVKVKQEPDLSDSDDVDDGELYDFRTKSTL